MCLSFTADAAETRKNKSTKPCVAKLFNAHHVAQQGCWYSPSYHLDEVQILIPTNSSLSMSSDERRSHLTVHIHMHTIHAHTYICMVDTTSLCVPQKPNLYIAHTERETSS